MLSVPWASIACGPCYKNFTIVIYYHNDSGQYYKTTITIVSYALALASLATI